MGIFDRFFKRPKPTDTVGLEGFLAPGGLITSHERAPELNGIRKYRTYSELIQNTSAIAAGVRSYLDFIGQPNWRADPAKKHKDNPKAIEYAEIINEAMNGGERPWSRIVKRAATHVFYGFDIQEITFGRREDGVVTIESIDPRPQHTIERWDIDEFGRVIGVLQRTDDAREAYLPIWKCVYTVDDSLTDSPEGLGLLRQVVAAAQKLTRLEQLEAFGYETDLRGIPVGRAPLSKLAEMVEKGKLDKAEAAAITAPIRQFLERHIKTPTLGLLLDSMVYESSDKKPSNIFRESIELLQSDASGLSEVSAAILRLNHEIARVLGVEHILLGQDRGTQSLSKDKTDTFRTRIESILTELAWTFQKQVVEQLAIANGWDKELWPSIQHDPIRQAQVAELAQTMESLARAGAILAPDDPVINAIRDLLRLPQATVPDLSLRNETLDLDLQIPTPNKKPTGSSHEEDE